MAIGIPRLAGSPSINGAHAKRPSSPLDNTSLAADPKVKVPGTMGTQMMQVHVFGDPFDQFEEGLDPANENGLDIENEGGKISVSVAGASYTDGDKDAYNETQIKPLQYSDAAERYLVTNKYEGKDAYQLLVNVDSDEGKAKLWMRAKEDQKWSNWEPIAAYESWED